MSRALGSSFRAPCHFVVAGLGLLSSSPSVIPLTVVQMPIHTHRGVDMPSIYPLGWTQIEREREGKFGPDPGRWTDSEIEPDR